MISNLLARDQPTERDVFGSDLSGRQTDDERQTDSEWTFSPFFNSTALQSRAKRALKALSDLIGVPSAN